jgi:MFS family permease
LKRPDHRRIAEFLGLRKSMVALLAMVVLVGLGEKMAERFLPLYMMALGGGTFAIGLLNGMDNLLGALYSYPGGYISDRFGFKRALLIFNVIAMMGYLIVILIPHWQAALVGAVLFMSWTAISLPATMETVASVLPSKKRTMGVSMHSIVKRIPMSLGPLLGGAMIGLYGETRGIRLAFVVALVLAAVSLVLQQFLFGSESSATPNKHKPSTPKGALIPPVLRSLLVSDILVRFCEQIPYAFVVIWCVSMQRITAFEFGVLTTIEMATAVLVYIPVAYAADKSTKKPFVVTTFVFFTAFPLVLLFAKSFWLMAVAFVIRGLKEFGEPTRKALIMDLAPEGMKAATFGLYYLIRDVIVSVAAFGGALLWDGTTTRMIADKLGVDGPVVDFLQSAASPQLTLLVAAGFGLLGTVYFAVFGRDLGRAE